MAYKKYFYRNGKKFGPYYYQSYRDDSGKVKKRYIGTEDPNKKEKNNKFKKIKPITPTRNISVFLVVLLLIIGFVALFALNLQFTGKVIDESITEEFDTNIIDLEIKEPVMVLGDSVSKNKNKRMDFNIPEGNIRLYFDLLNYSRFVGEVAEEVAGEQGVGVIDLFNQTEEIKSEVEINETEEIDVINETIEEIELVNITEVEESEEISNVTQDEVSEVEGEDEESIEEIEEEIVEEEIESEVEINETEEEIVEELVEGEEAEVIEESESESVEEIVEEELELVPEPEEVLEPELIITGSIIKVFFGSVRAIIQNIQSTGRVIEDINKTEVQTITDNQTLVEFEEIQDKIEELNKSELGQIDDESVVEAEGFDVEVNKSGESGYKWGYKVRLNDLNFMAKIDITSDQEIFIYNENTLQIGNSLMSFSDLIDEGYTVRIGSPVLEIEVEDVVVDDFEVVSDISEDEIEDEIEEEIESEVEINETEEIEESIGNVSQEEVDEVVEKEKKEKEEKEKKEKKEKKESRMGEESPLTSHPSLKETEEKEKKEKEEVVEKEEKEKKEKKEKKEGEDVGITGNIIRGFLGITGMVVDAVINNSVGEVQDLEYDNIITIYIERDFSNVSSPDGGIIKWVMRLCWTLL